MAVSETAYFLRDIEEIIQNYRFFRRKYTQYSIMYKQLYVPDSDKTTLRIKHILCGNECLKERKRLLSYYFGSLAKSTILRPAKLPSKTFIHIFKYNNTLLVPSQYASGLITVEPNAIHIVKALKGVIHILLNTTNQIEQQENGVLKTYYIDSFTHQRNKSTDSECLCFKPGWQYVIMTTDRALFYQKIFTNNDKDITAVVADIVSKVVVLNEEQDKTQQLNQPFDKVVKPHTQEDCVAINDINTVTTTTITTTTTKKREEDNGTNNYVALETTSQVFPEVKMNNKVNFASPNNNNAVIQETVKKVFTIDNNQSETKNYSNKSDILYTIEKLNNSQRMDCNDYKTLGFNTSLQSAYNTTILTNNDEHEEADIFHDVPIKLKEVKHGAIILNSYRRIQESKSHMLLSNNIGIENNNQDETKMSFANLNKKELQVIVELYRDFLNKNY